MSRGVRWSLDEYMQYLRNKDQSQKKEDIMEEETFSQLKVKKQRMKAMNEKNDLQFCKSYLKRRDICH